MAHPLLDLVLKMLMQLFCEYYVQMMNLLDILFVVQVPRVKKNIELIYTVSS